MATISDVIENFILSTLGTNNDLNLSRNELAGYFNCAPSQINYVLTTRFNLNRGFIIQSQRGGGGYIRIVRIKDFDDNYIHKVIDSIGDEINFNEARFILEDLMNKKFLTPSQAKTTLYAVSDKALTNPIKLEGKLRANILKNVFINILKEKENE